LCRFTLEEVRDEDKYVKCRGQKVGALQGLRGWTKNIVDVYDAFGGGLGAGDILRGVKMVRSENDSLMRKRGDTYTLGEDLTLSKFLSFGSSPRRPPGSCYMLRKSPLWYSSR